MKQMFFLSACFLFLLSSCTHPKDEPVVGDSYIGHWEWTDALDAQFRPMDPGYVEQFYLEEDGTWKMLRDGVVYSEGTYTSQHEDSCMIDEYNYGPQDYFLLKTSEETRKEYYIYDKSKDRLTFTYEPGMVGIPFKQWKRIAIQH